MLRALWDEFKASYFLEEGDELILRLNHLVYGVLNKKTPSSECLYSDWHAYLAAYTYFPIPSRAIPGGHNPEGMEVECIENTLLHYYLTMRTYFDTMWPASPGIRRPVLTQEQIKKLQDIAKERPRLLKTPLKHLSPDEVGLLIRKENHKLRQLVMHANQVAGAFSKIKGQDWTEEYHSHKVSQPLPVIHEHIISLTKEMEELSTQNQQQLSR